MRSSCSIYVDAGYLLASSATRITGTSLRSGIRVDYAGLIEALIRQAEEVSGLPVLRLHWYDSAKDGVPDSQQEKIGELPRVKLRLGRIGVDGQQKGVDLRIGLDLVAHARNGAAEVFLLVSGDDDLTEAVEEAQVHGVQVVVMAVPNSDAKPHGLSRHLLRSADQVAVVEPAAIDAAVSKVVAPRPAPDSLGLKRPTPSPAQLAGKPRPDLAFPTPGYAYRGSTGQASHVAPSFRAPDDYAAEIDRVVTNVIESFRKSASTEDSGALLEQRPSIPRDIDRALLLDLSDEIGDYELSDAMRYRLRSRFWELYDAA